LEYKYRTGHPALRWLPTELAEWIGDNFQDELGFPDKADKRAPPRTGWTPVELNHILQAHDVDGTLTTFGCVEWWRKKAARNERIKRGWETRRHPKADKA
jgi:hypothetical protein